MALLLVDGFDQDDATEYLWWTPTAGISGTTSGDRWGASTPSRYHLAQLGSLRKSLPASGATAIVGFAGRASVNDFITPIVALYDGVGAGFEQCSLIALDSGAVQVRRSTNLILATSAPGLLRRGAFYYIEWKVTIANTGGTTEVRINGKTVLTATSLDTQVTANATWNAIQFVPVIAFGTSQWRIGDVYVCDGSGSAPYNDFLGDVRVETLFPQTDAVSAGSNAGLTPSTGTDHGALVDETAANGDTDYNSTATAGNKDTYQYPAMASAGDILCVQPLLLARKTDAVPKTVAPVLRHSGTDYDGTTQSAGVLYSYLHQLYTQNPGTSVAFTTADVAALQVGMKSVL